MSGFAHVLLALGVALFANRLSEGKFTTKHALVLSFNSFLGPDLMNFLPYTSQLYYLFHDSFGWLLLAIPLTFVWRVLVVDVQWKGFKPHRIREDTSHKSIMSYAQLWLLVAAGGLLHQFLDTIAHPSYISYGSNPNEPWGVLWFGGDLFLGITDIWKFGSFPEVTYLATYIFSYAICGVLFLLGFLLYAHRGPHQLLKFIIAAMLIYLIPLAIAQAVPAMSDPTKGSSFYLIGGEADLGVMIFILGWLFLPLTFLYYSYHPLPSRQKIFALLKEIFNIKGWGKAVKQHFATLKHGNVDEKIEQVANKSEPFKEQAT